MRYLIILLLFPMYCNAQYPIYTEFNGGVGITYERDALPTIALVAGKMFPMGDYSFVDLQAGLAYESIFTGKVGVGSWFGDNEAFSIQGGYLQSSGRSSADILMTTGQVLQMIILRCVQSKLSLCHLNTLVLIV